MNFEPGTRTVNLASIIAPGDVAARMAALHVVELAKDIAELGGEPINPILVTKARAGWRLIAGRDRYSALKLNGAKVATVRVVVDATPQELHDLEVSENLHRRIDNRDVLIAERVRKVAERLAADPKFPDKLSGNPLGGPRPTTIGEARKIVAAEQGTTPEAIRKAVARAEEREEGEAGSRQGANAAPPPPPIETLGKELTETDRSFIAAQHEMIAAIEAASRAAQAAVAKFTKSGWAYGMDAQLDDLQRAAQELGAKARAAKLTSVCPYCKAKSRACKGCNGALFVTAGQLAAAPAEKRDGRSSDVRQSASSTRNDTKQGDHLTVAREKGATVAIRLDGKKPKSRMTVTLADGREMSIEEAEAFVAGLADEQRTPDAEPGDVAEEEIPF